MLDTSASLVSSQVYRFGFDVMKMRQVIFWMVLASAIATGALGGDDWVTVKPEEFEGAINNPLKGFRSYHSNGYGLLHRQYIGWSDIELSDEDTVERIIARTNEITAAGARVSAN